jgi:hypothetical protein
MKRVSVFDSIIFLIMVGLPIILVDTGNIELKNCPLRAAL